MFKDLTEAEISQKEEKISVQIKETEGLDQDFEQELRSNLSPENKVRVCLQHMKSALEQQASPRLKKFWQARSLCAQFFKELTSPHVRTELWKEYKELCLEFQKLKAVLDEHSSFAAEQIDIAIKAIEEDFKHFTEKLTQFAFENFQNFPNFLQKREKLYIDLQKKLSLLNTFASKIDALRKELMKVEMRMRQKNKFFQSLSSLGDQVFPKRKELVGNLSEVFLKDTQDFIHTYFEKEFLKAPSFFLREEIKAFQGLAKELNLNTHVFTTTRNALSQCWDRLKEIEKEKKKDIAEKRSLYKANQDMLLEKIASYKKSIESQEISLNQLDETSKKLYNLINSVELGKEEKLKIKEAIGEALKPLLDEQQALENERIQKEKAASEEKTKKIEELKQKLHWIIEHVEQESLDSLKAIQDEVVHLAHAIACSKADKMHLDKLLKQVKSLLHHKEEKNLLSLPSLDLNILEQLKIALRERQKQRQDIKANLEAHRKVSGSSSLNFEKALHFREIIQEEKEELEKTEQSIKELELKIKALSHQLKSS